MVVLENIAVQLLSTLFYSSILFLIASGLNMIYGIMRLVNLSHTALFSLGAYIAAWITGLYVVKIFGAMPLALLTIPAIFACIGVLIAAMITSPLLISSYNKGEELQLILTFGLLLVFEDIFQLFWGRVPLTSREAFFSLGQISIGSYIYPVYNIYVIIFTMIIAVVMWFIIYRTRLGMILRAVSMDPEMSSALGIDLRRALITSIAVASVLAGLGGALYLPAAAIQLGFSIEILVVAFVVMIIGGLGSFYGSLIGAIITGLIRTISLAFFPELELALLYIIAIAILLLKPEGIGGGRGW
jgi:branched-chain amino acid transport system permease protein